MLIIILALKLSALVLALISLVLITLLLIKKKYNTIPNIKVWIIMTSIISVIFFLQVILGIILKESVFNDILGLVTYILCTLIGFLNLKIVKSKQNYLKNHIILGTDTKNEEITEEDAVTEVSTENNK